MTISEAPTIPAPAAVLQRPDDPGAALLLLLKAGTQTPPIYFAHGLAASALELSPVVRHLGLSNPIYGLQAPDIAGPGQPGATIEARAKLYLDAILRRQPAGPYYLVGYSLGGLVMFEIARLLSGRGEKVGLLALVDSYPHASRLALGARWRLLATLSRRRISLLRRSLTGPRRGHLRANQAGLSPPRNDASGNPAVRRARELDYGALRNYQPRFYAGRIHFLKAAIATNFPRDPAAVWGRLAEEVAVEMVPGDHLGMITAYSESLALRLTDRLQQALASREGSGR